MAGKKKIRSHVKRLKMQQKKHPMSRKKYIQQLRIARRKDFLRNFGKAVLIICIAAVALLAAGNYVFYKKSGQTLVQCMKEAKTLAAESSPEDFRYAQTTYIFSDNDRKLAELSEDIDATYLTYDQIPEDVVNAFVAVEDRTFWTNEGIDYKGMARVVLNYIRTRGEVAEGASTITQQLARGAFLTNEKTMSRKIKEIFLARELNKKYSKEQIMEFYCNTCCFANGIYGIEDAAERYFDKPVSDLTLSEIAYICAIPNRPEYYNPLKEPQNAISRRDKILNDMQACGYITQAACTAAKDQTIEVAEIHEDESFYNYEVTYAIDCAVRNFMEQDGFEFRYRFDSDEDYDSYGKLYEEAYSQAKHKLYTGGYKVYTTMNLEMQTVLQHVIDEQLAFSKKTKENTGIYELQSALTVIDNDTGKVVAMIGGRSQSEISKTYSLNRGYQGYAQPGSSIKPLAVYTPALENGYHDYSDLKNIDVKEAQTSTAEEISKMSGNSVPLRTAVEKSLNGCAYWLFNEITPAVGMNYVTDLHFSRIAPRDYTMSASLGGLTHGVSTVEMANAYSTLENHGIYTQADCIRSILDSNGEEIYEEPDSRHVYAMDAADMMTDIMKGVITKGTARRMDWYSQTDTEAAGKTGTTNDNKAAWFCGYTPYYTLAVWVGSDDWVTDPDIEDGPYGILEGGTYPASIWKEAMLYLIEDLPERSFDLASIEYAGDDEEEEVDFEDLPDISEDQEDDFELPADVPDDTTQTINGTDGSENNVPGTDIPMVPSGQEDTGTDSENGNDADGSEGNGSSGQDGTEGENSGSDDSGSAGEGADQNGEGEQQSDSLDAPPGQNPGRG